MLIRNQPLEIPHDDPFKNDVLERREIETILTHFVKSGVGPFVIAINSPWGTGKTTFLKMWKESLSKKDDVCFYLNAWETDFSADPIIPITTSLSDEISHHFSRDSKIKENLEKVKRVAGSIAKRAVPAMIKLVTLGAIDAKEITETIIADFASQLTEDKIKSFEVSKNEILEFKKTLSYISNKIMQEGGKLIVMVDELDRCKPLFAVQLLERIKHLFDIDGVVFVLGIHLQELSHSIKAVYGSDFDAVGYLRRFIDFEYRLKNPDAKTFCKHLIERFEVFSQSRHTGTITTPVDKLTTTLSLLFSSVGLSLREQEQFISRLGIVMRTIPPIQRVFEIPLIILLFLKGAYPAEYDSLLRNEMSFTDILLLLENEPRMKGLFDCNEGRTIEAFLLYGDLFNGNKT